MNGHLNYGTGWLWLDFADSEMVPVKFLNITLTE